MRAGASGIYSEQESGEMLPPTAVYRCSFPSDGGVKDQLVSGYVGTWVGMSPLVECYEL